MATVTDEVRIAAEEAFAIELNKEPHTLAGCLRAALEAVQPIIAKAERLRMAKSFGDMLTVLGNSPDEAVAVTARLLKEGFDQQMAAWQ